MYNILQGRDGKGSVYVFANGNGGFVDDDCAANGYSLSIYIIAVGALSVTGDFSPFDEPCSAKMVTAYVTTQFGGGAIVRSLHMYVCISYAHLQN